MIGRWQAEVIRALRTEGTGGQLPERVLYERVLRDASEPGEVVGSLARRGLVAHLGTRVALTHLGRHWSAAVLAAARRDEARDAGYPAAEAAWEATRRTLARKATRMESRAKEQSDGIEA